METAELVRQAWAWAPEHARIKLAASEIPELQQAKELVRDYMQATEAEIDTALASFVLHELKGRPYEYWLHLLMNEIGARRASTNPEIRAHFARANHRRADAEKKRNEAKAEATKRRTKKKPA